ncbi:nuclear transport factor 2 family protein [Actinoplanes philippinensis]|uniref:nuclear transport factor 2 family protein n=1 Tax=Actinoplanes philippinensis TaxID=35752 RepID=UPI0033DDBF9F
MTVLDTAKQLFERWAANDPAGLRELLTDDATLVLPLSADGSPEPFYTFTGVDGVLAYMQGAMANLPQIRFVNQQWHVSDDARYVHLHADGDMVAKTGAPYRNTYVYRLTFRDGRIAAIDEYANPVAWTKLGL